MYTPHTLVAFGGSLIGVTGKDQWQCGIRGGSFNNPNQAFGNSEAFLANLHADLATWFGSNAAKMHPNATLEWLKINDIGANGKYVELVTHRFDYSPIVTANISTAAAAPAYMSVAYTWETGVARGLAHRGRIFPPNGGIVMQKGSEISQADALIAAQQGELLLSKIVNASDVATVGVDQFSPAVYSFKDGSFRAITAVSCDCLYDEQHRRKEQTNTTRSTVQVDYSTH